MESSHSIPERLGKYEVLGILGQGGMGVVYKGYDAQIGRYVAIKTIHRSMLKGDLGRELITRFQQEVKAVGRLTHANIVAIYDCSEEDGMPYFVMEFVDGKELKHYLKQGIVFSVSKTLSIITQMLDALTYAHRLGVIHRDIKPDNIFITDDGIAKLADFGIAKIEDNEVTQVGAVLGTPSYMSPEQCLGKPIDNRSDLFSIAIVLYELLTGQKCFKGENPEMVMKQIINGQPIKPSALVDRVPTKVDNVINVALAKKQDERYQKADDFREALVDAFSPKRQVLRNGVIAAATVGTLLLGFQMAIIIGKDKVTIDDIKVEHLFPDSQKKVIASTVTGDDKQKVGRLLKVASAHQRIGRLLGPKGSNAYDTYQLILRIDPYNTSAKVGIEKVADLVWSKSFEYYQEKKNDKGQRLTQEALSLFPEHAGLNELKWYFVHE